VLPSATRLLARIGPLSGERLGLELLLALLLGIPALIDGVLRRTSGSDPPPSDIAVADASDMDSYRMRRAVAIGLGVWLLTGIVLFSHMARLHPRYVEGLVPAVTATLGIGLAWATSSSGRARLIALIVGMAALIYYGERLLYGRPGSWWIALAGALGAIAFAALTRIRVNPSPRSSALLTAGALALALLALVAIPVEVDKTAIANRVSDAGYIGALPGGQQRALSSYLIAHQGSARYELASESATGIGSLIVQDARPVVVLTTYEARVFKTVAQLKQLIAEGAVRYAFLNTYCGTYSTTNAACSEPARWIREHGTDVSIQAGLEHHKLLYLLPGAKP
jgi:hypothetical protein